ncbi:MAG: oligoendopeptidase F, partial [Caldilineaceae bacterium]|nr:oligoendopeptidase F [Caldilineaceae bacterium]
LADPFSGAGTTYRELTNADLRVADAVDSQGRHHPVRDATPAPTGIQSADRTHRRTAWQNFADSHLAIQNSLAGTYLTVVKQHVFLAKVRGYNSVLEMMLASSNLPVAVFHNVINTFKRELPLWHRYWAVKRKALGVDALHPYDIYAPLTNSVPHVPYQQAVDWIGEALQPLGEPYVNALQRGALDERWVDYAPTAGKMGGAAATPFGVIPPFIYMSYDESLMSASVLAHELGHSMHFQLNTELQPHVYRNYQIMSASVVETASNFHQAMLRAYLQSAKQTDRSFTLALIDEAMFNFHRYFFIMPTLARFELAVYGRVEAGQSLTVNDLNQTMSDLFAEGYGDTLADDPTRTAITWAQFM